MNRILVSLIFVWAMCFLAVAASATPLVFQRLVDSHTLVPGTNSAFVPHGTFDVQDGALLILAHDSAGKYGLYRASETGISVVVNDHSTALSGMTFDTSQPCGEAAQWMGIQRHSDGSTSRYRLLEEFVAGSLSQAPMESKR